MKKICAWCKIILEPGDAAAAGDAPVSHGICHACAGKLLTAKPLALAEFLDRLDFPVLLVKAESGIELANRRACAMLGRTPELVKGKWPEDVAECIYAKAPGGCGRDVHCTGCALRQTLLDTFATGKSHKNVPASATLLPRGIPQPVQFLISTEKAGDFVLLRMEAVDSESKN